MNHPNEMDSFAAPLPPASFRPDLRVVGDQPHKTNPEPRAVGSPLPVGSGVQGYRSAPPPGRALPGNSEADGSQRALSVLNAALPFVQQVLPFIESNFGRAITNLFNSRPLNMMPPPVDLSPVQSQLTDLQLRQAELRTGIVEQNSSLKRFQDQLETVREATDRNTSEQQDLVDGLKAMGNKINLFAIVLSVLLTMSALLNLLLFLHIKQALH